MGFLKNVAYTLMSLIGICAVIAIGVFVSVSGAVLGTLVSGAAVVVLVASGIKEYFERPPDRDK